MTPDISTIRAARKWLDWRISHDEKLVGEPTGEAEIIRFALSFYEKCLQELSEEAIECGYSAGDGEIRANSIFKAVITQIQKEVAGGL